MASDLQVTRGDAHAVLTLDRPTKKNALSIALRDEISDALDALADDPQIKAVVITGAGDTFSAGFDLSEFTARARRRGVRRRRSGRRAIATTTPCCGSRCPPSRPSTDPRSPAASTSRCCCDLRIAATTARFAHPEYTFGDVVYSPLADLVGGAVARELCLTGRTVDAGEALALHLVDAVVAPDELATATRRMVEQVQRAPRANLVRTKAKAVARLGFGRRTTTLDL